MLDRYDDFLVDRHAWDQAMAQLLALSQFPPTIRYSTLGNDYLVGFYPPEGMTTPRWWRIDQGLLVPRKRTRAEKASEVNKLWSKLKTIPEAVNYVPGLPNTLWVGDKAYAPVVRKPAQAVLVFLGMDPAKATQPFVMGAEWTPLKVSTFNLLRERQHAAEQVT